MRIMVQISRHYGDFTQRVIRITVSNTCDSRSQQHSIVKILNTQHVRIMGETSEPKAVIRLGSAGVTVGFSSMRHSLDENQS